MLPVLPSPQLSNHRHIQLLLRTLGHPLLLPTANLRFSPGLLQWLPPCSTLVLPIIYPPRRATAIFRKGNSDHDSPQTPPKPFNAWDEFQIPHAGSQSPRASTSGPPVPPVLEGRPLTCWPTRYWPPPRSLSHLRPLPERFLCLKVLLLNFMELLLIPTQPTCHLLLEAILPPTSKEALVTLLTACPSPWLEPRRQGLLCLAQRGVPSSQSRPGTE